MFLIKLFLSLLLLLSSVVVLSSSYISSNITCKSVDVWSESEKKLLTEKLANKNFDNLIFSKVNKNYISKKTENCIYKSDVFNLSFHQNNKIGGGYIYITPVRKIHNGKKLVYSKYLVYMLGDYNIKKQFLFEINEKVNYYDITGAKFHYGRHLYPEKYVVVAIFIYEDKKKYAYAIKAKPTTRW